MGGKESTTMLQKCRPDEFPVRFRYIQAQNPVDVEEVEFSLIMDWRFMKECDKRFKQEDVPMGGGLVCRLTDESAEMDLVFMQQNTRLLVGLPGLPPETGIPRNE
ncbi:MAG: hypothetical protein LR011_08860 [Verrucomicrobia bacterium]|nr:hypothetical protein [Verrucomicrobiota bacterium]